MCAGRDANRPIGGGAHALSVQLNGPAPGQRYFGAYPLRHDNVQVELVCGTLPGNLQLAVWSRDHSASPFQSRGDGMNGYGAESGSGGLYTENAADIWISGVPVHPWL